MDTIEKYRKIIQEVLTEYAKIPFSHGDFKSRTIFDLQSNHYLLMLIGWDDIRRVHGCLVHIDIINDKVWIQRDGTEQGIATELLKAGIPKESIVLGFRSLELRRHTEFAVE